MERSPIDKLLDEVGPYRSVFQREIPLEKLDVLMYRAKKRRVKVLAQVRGPVVLVTLKKLVGKG